MARKAQQDQARAKAAKQKKILIVASVLLVGLLAFQGPKTMKLLSGNRAAPTTSASAPAPVSTTTTDTTAATTTPAATPPAGSVAAPSLSAPATTTPSTSSSSGSQLVASIEPAPDPGQLDQFYRFASKDPFAAQAAAPAASASPKPAAGGATKTTASAPAAPPPSSAVISVNGLLGQVGVGAAFPTSGPVFDRVGALFQLISLTQTTAQVIVVGGSYANGAQALTLTVGKAVTLQNTADGTRYTLLLEPQGTQAPAAGGSAPGAAPATTTTTPPVVPPATTTTTSGG